MKSDKTYIRKRSYGINQELGEWLLIPEPRNRKAKILSQIFLE